MALTNKHTTYTSNDLFRYAQGLMPPLQMHALEKAALEDPFLAEALDGYLDAHAAMPSDTEQEAIRSKLEAFKNKIPFTLKEEKAPKLLPLWQQKWLQYAVAASIVLGTGWWILSLNNKEPKTKVVVAQNETPTGIPYDTTPTTTPINASPNQPTTNTIEATTTPPTSTARQQPIASPGLALNDSNSLDDHITSSGTLAMKDEDKAATNDFTTNKAKNASAPILAKEEAVMDIQQRSIAKKQQQLSETSTSNMANMRRFTFNGKIVDANNTPLPYSNVMIPGEQIGTYADAKGNFNFVYIDSTLPVRARSLGYEEQTFVMTPSANENKIVLKEDEALKSKMLVSRQQKQPRNQSYAPIIIEKDSITTAEPSVGWLDYNIYALNNNRAIDLSSPKPIQLSFEVDTDGSVQNIIVEKSSGKEHDEEAIRLLKEGPKWKNKKGVKVRNRITIKL